MINNLKFIEEFNRFNEEHFLKYSANIHHDPATSNIFIYMKDHDTGKSISHGLPYFSLTMDANLDFRKVLEKLAKELYDKSENEKFEPVKEFFMVDIDISDDVDESAIVVQKMVGTGCCRELELVNTISGDEAIELYKKLVGG